ncbi:hypothetical protein [Persicobacter diffluens]|uniref:Uncharacterized protein n=1 Tax=Persicobacter diffluens TaxID=981 RepID=A0AAN4W4B7_9BACT|nr:hypothetical protein PEDI_55700 [Persicobacter diffluens]
MRKNILNLCKTPTMLKGKSITNIWIYLYEPFDNTNFSKFEELDGDLYLEINRELIIAFYPKTEDCSIEYEIVSLETLPVPLINVLSSSYWEQRTNIQIVKVECILEYLPIPAGIRIFFENGIKTEIKYISDDGNVFDSLQIC